MQQTSSPIPRKLVEMAFRRVLLLAIPVIAVPVLVLLLTDHPAVYRSTAVAWVGDLSGSGATAFAGASGSSDQTASERQVAVINDLLATRSFRDAVVVTAKMVPAGADASAVAFARNRLSAQLVAVATGPNLVSLSADAATADEAHRLAAAFVAEVQDRLKGESAREAAVVLSYFETQVTQAKADVAETGAALASYRKLHPSVEANPDAEFSRLSGLLTAQEAVLQRVLQSQNDAELQAASIAASGEALFVVQDEALTPAAPEAVPLKTRAVYPAAGLALGLMLSLGLLYAWYRTDRSIRSTADLDGLDLLVLGAIPELRPGDLARRFAPIRLGLFRRDYARRVAASISPVPSDEKAAS